MQFEIVCANLDHLNKDFSKNGSELARLVSDESIKELLVFLLYKCPTEHCLKYLVR